MLERWLREVLATPGLTATRVLDDARRVLLDDAVRGLPLVAAEDGPVVDVGSGSGSPGIPLAAYLPSRPVTLLEAKGRKCRFLERWTGELPNLRVVCGRAEEQPLEEYGVVLAKALAPPPVAAEWCLPLARTGGVVLLWAGPSADAMACAAAARRVGGEAERSLEGFIALRKVAATPAGFPRRTGVARKRPLA